MNADIDLTLRARGANPFMRTWDQNLAPANLRDLDAQALGALYDQYAGSVFRYIQYRLNDEHLAEDLSGDVFLSLLEALRRGGGPQTNIKAWLMATASHLVADHLRRRYRRQTLPLYESLADPDQAPGEEFDRRQQSQDFRVAYSRLTHEQQHVLALRFGDGFSLEETAAIIDKNVNAVKALQFRAMQALQRHLGRAHGE